MNIGLAAVVQIAVQTLPQLGWLSVSVDFDSFADQGIFLVFSIRRQEPSRLFGEDVPELEQEQNEA